MTARTRARLSGVAPWSGLIGAGTGWGLHQQVVTEALHFDCRVTADGRGMLLGVVALSIVASGALLSWRALPAADVPPAMGTMRRFIVHLSLMAALLAMLGIGFHFLASALLPGCQPA